MDAVGAFVATVGFLDAEGGDEEHGEGEPEGAVGAVNGTTEGVADAELEDAGDELGGAAEEDGEAEDGLVGADGGTDRPGVGDTEIVSLEGCAWVEGKDEDIPDAALVEAETKGGQCETDETKRTRVGDLEEGRIVDLGDGCTVRLVTWKDVSGVGFHVIVGMVLWLLEAIRARIVSAADVVLVSFSLSGHDEDSRLQLGNT